MIARLVVLVALFVVTMAAAEGEDSPLPQAGVERKLKGRNRQKNKNKKNAPPAAQEDKAEAVQEILKGEEAEEAKDDPNDLFDPKLTLEDYNRMAKKKGPILPSDKWLASCAHNVTSYQHHRELQLENTGGEVMRLGDVRRKLRLGDCVRWCSKRTCAAGIGKRYSRYGCYGNENSMKEGNLTALEMAMDYVNKKEHFHTPEPDEMIIHLRMGDVIEDTKADVVTMLTKGTRTVHDDMPVKTIASVHTILSIIKAYKPAKVAIRGGTHHAGKRGDVKGDVYVSCLQKGLARAGHPTPPFVKNEFSMDEDFYYNSHAKLFVVSTGGYSRLMGRMVNYYGGKAVKPWYFDPKNLKKGEVDWEDNTYVEVKPEDLP